MANIFYDRDADIERIRSKKVGIIGYGAQGRAHALNLSDSGVDVRVGLRTGSPNRTLAESEDMAVGTIADVARWADVLAVLVRDTAQPHVYQEYIHPALCAGKTLVFAHAFNIHFATILPPPDVDVVLVAPKGPGSLVRSAFKAKDGVPALVAVHQNHSGFARENALSYAKALGATRAWTLLTTFRKEAEWRHALGASPVVDSAHVPVRGSATNPLFPFGGGLFANRTRFTRGRSTTIPR